MKNMRKLLALALVLILAMSFATTAFAADNVTVNSDAPLDGNGSITFNLPAEGFDNGATYKIYKVFDATVSADGQNISYKLVEGKTTAPTGFEKDAAGNVTYKGTGNPADINGTTLTPTDIEAIASYVHGDDPMCTVTLHSGVKTYTLEGVPYGYYYITTSSGSVVSIDTADENVVVNDKNVAPTMTKEVSRIDHPDGKIAIERAGGKVEFTITIEVGTGAKSYVLRDYMSAGLSLDVDSIQVLIPGASNDETVFLRKDIDYTLTTSTQLGDPCFTITFGDYALNKEYPNATIQVQYRATIVDADLFTGAENYAELTYGDEEDTTDDTAVVYSARVSVNKVDGNGKPLADAGFVLKNEAGDYYHLENNSVIFTTEDKADVHTSLEDGTVPPFTGLAPGTYTLVEYVVPAGYNKAEDITFTISNANGIDDIQTLQSILNQQFTVTNNAGSVLPSTGGMGTTLFYVFGVIMVLGAAVLLITKKRMASAE